jgi:hypothetical protein
MHSNAQLIEQFYSAFQDKDYKTMQSCYTDNMVFTDPVFTGLDAGLAKGMWEMFCKKGDFISLEFRNIRAVDHLGSAEWIATYIFSGTGRRVRNHIFADFVFESGKITQHTDDFNFYKWARQAFGFKGLLLGWTPFFKNKVRKTARKNLDNFIRLKDL